MITQCKVLIALILLTSPLFPQDSVPRVEMLHPRQDMQFWVNQIEVAGDIPEGTSLTVLDSTVTPNEKGRFRYLIELQQDTVFIPLVETTESMTFFDTIRVFRRTADHMTPDSVFINHNIPDSLELHLYPKSRKYAGRSISLRGYTHPLADVTVNGDTLNVYASGAFTHFIELHPGDNTYEFIASLDGETISDQIILTHPQPRVALESLDGKSAAPRRERWIMAGDELHASINGPINSKVYCKIPGLTKWMVMTESRPGRYNTMIPLLDVEEELDSKVIYRLGTFSPRVKSADVKVLTKALGGVTADEDTRVYDTATTDQLLFPLSDSIMVQIIGLENRMYKIRLGQYRTGYMRANLVRLDSSSVLYEPHSVGAIFSENNGEWTIYRLYTGNKRLPFELKEKAVPSRLELKVYGTKQGWEWTTYPENDSAIAFLEKSQPEDQVWQMDFYPAQRFWGWYAHYEGNYLVVGIRNAPRVIREKPFANIRIEIDPGHGGWQRGAMGITGYGEADANLRYSLKLEQLLVEAGATVFMTRREDSQLSLADRAKIAREDSVHIFIMAHNNAPGSSRDIEKAKGTSTFYTWPSAKALSDHIYPHLQDMGIATGGKVSRYYYYLTRQTEYLVYLIEGAFMTNPDEEMFLRSEEGLNALAQAAFNGLEDFLLEQAEAEADY